jgi:hypothetical protein
LTETPATFLRFFLMVLGVIATTPSSSDRPAAYAEPETHLQLGQERSGLGGYHRVDGVGERLRQLAAGDRDRIRCREVARGLRTDGVTLDGGDLDQAPPEDAAS